MFSSRKQKQTNDFELSRVLVESVMIIYGHKREKSHEGEVKDCQNETRERKVFGAATVKKSKVFDCISFHWICDMNSSPQRINFRFWWWLVENLSIKKSSSFPFFHSFSTFLCVMDTGHWMAGMTCENCEKSQVSFPQHFRLFWVMKIQSILF